MGVLYVWTTAVWRDVVEMVEVGVKLLVTVCYGRIDVDFFLLYQLEQVSIADRRMVSDCNSVGVLE